MMIKAVFFDYDGVLTRDKTGSLTTNRFLSEQTGLPYDAVERAFRRHNEALNEGESTYRDIWPVVCAELKRRIPFDFLIGAFASTPINDEMLRLCRDLKRRYAVGIVTDNKKERFDYLQRHQRLTEVFAPIVVSAVVGCTKAHPAIFRRALARSNVAPQESIFIDNTRGNLVVPAALGMKTVHFDDEKNDVAGLARLLRVEFGVSSEGNACLYS